MKEYIEALQGITFGEWIKLRTAIDRRFEQKIGEFKKELKLSGAPSFHQRYGGLRHSLITQSGSSLRQTHSPARHA